MDQKSKTQLAITGVLGVILIFLLWLNVFGPMLRKRSAHRTQSPAPVAAVTGLSTPVAAERLSPAALQSRRDSALVYEQESWGRNPFLGELPAAVIPADEPQVTSRSFQQPPRFALEGIVYDKTNPYAIINGELRVVGDILQNFKIISIGEDKVTLERDGNVIDLRIFSEL